MKHKWGVFKALLVAAAFSNVFASVTWRKIWYAFILWFGLLHDGEKVDAWVYGKRLETCRKCPLYYPKLKTCGTPLRKEHPELGCWCFMPEKAKYGISGCWLDEYAEWGHPSGWHSAINTGGQGPVHSQ